MKIVESWLREWVDPDLDSKALEHQLTMLGLEVDGVEVEGTGLDGVVVGEVVEVAGHADARGLLGVADVAAAQLDGDGGAPMNWSMSSAARRMSARD